MRLSLQPSARTLAALCVLAAGWGGVACVSSGASSASAVPASEMPFLVSPAMGWPGSLSPERASRIQELYGDLVDGGQTLAVMNEALRYLEREPDFQPARVLEAQVRFLNDRHASVVDLLEPLYAESPEYVAAVLLYARSAEKLGENLDAFEAYRAIESKSAAAAGRARALREDAVGELSGRFDEELAAGRADMATELLGHWRLYAPGDPLVLAAEERLAMAVADPEQQLEVLRELSAKPGADPELLRRRAELELRVGDVGIGLQLAESLAADAPEDLGMTDLLQRAKFRWRLSLLPAEVEKIARRAELSRSDYAVLLYWLFPGVRYGQPTEGRIATDVMDHPYREQIVRVINLGLLDVDGSVHRFAPDVAVSRQQALGALLRMVAAEPEKGACIGGSRVPTSVEQLCEVATACGLLIEAGECLPTTAVSGPAALEMIRRGQILLGTGG